jgi:hypothetical protein
LAESNVTENDPLDEDELEYLKVNQINEAPSFFVFLHWLSIYIDAVFSFPVLGDAGNSIINSKRSIKLIFILVTALNTVIMSCFSLDINDLKAFVLGPNI